MCANGSSCGRNYITEFRDGEQLVAETRVAAAKNKAECSEEKCNMLAWQAMSKETEYLIRVYNLL